MNKFRYSELDWLRVALILAVFLHHVFMPFNGDGWHVMNRESSKLLDDIMVYFEQLRLQTLFFIAGAGSFVLLQKATAIEFIVSKFHRLFIPLIIGMMLIVPPQIYFENINDYKSIFEAYQTLVFSFNSNHLWFIGFLIVFMILAIPINHMLHGKIGISFIGCLERISSVKHGLFSLVISVILLRLSLKFMMPSQSHSIENLSVSLFYLFFFFAGMCFIKSPSIWQSLAKHRATNLKWFIFSSILFYAYYLKPDISEYVSLEVRWQFWWLVGTLVSWTGLLVLVGYASVLCKSTPGWLVTTNALIYPFYILHQTVIVALAFYIVQLDAGIAVKSVSLLFASLLLCAAVCYFLIKPFKIMRYMFGLRPNVLAYNKQL